MITAILDTETTGFLGADLLPLDHQPHMTEFAVKILDHNGEVRHQYSTLIKPPVPVSDKITEVTGITNEDLEQASPFIKVLPYIQEAFVGVERMIAHNLNFDKTILKHELQRVGMEFNFPWAVYDFCTSEHANRLYGNWTNLGNCHEILTGKQPEEAHRAMADVDTLITCCKLWNIL